jgi:hypothetical protein
MPSARSIPKISGTTRFKKMYIERGRKAPSIEAESRAIRFR